MRARQHGFFLNPYRFAVGGSDPDFANVEALLHFDGTNGGTSFPDVTGRAWSVSSPLVTNTSVKQFGSASGDFSGGTAAALSTPHDSGLLFNITAWTIEYWMRYGAGGGGTFHQMLSKRSGGTPNPINHFSTPSDGNAYFQIGTSGGAVGHVANIYSGSTWHHIAQVKNGNNLYTFVDGSALGSTVDLTGLTVTDGTDALIIGLNNDGNSNTQFTGYIDDFRLTMGVARYTSGFTPPSGPFPDS